MRHTFASWAIAAGLLTFEIAATMGTSLEQLSKTYAHLLPDSADRARIALDAFLAGRDTDTELRGLGTSWELIARTFAAYRDESPANR
jgi:hypothetical protein